MFRALNENNELISADVAVKGENYICPYCKENLILRQGSSVAWHFAHRPDSNCKETGEMCDWHLRMQSYFSPQYREIYIEKDGVVHRADVLKDGFVIEFQHSPISYEDFNTRNKFYVTLGYRVIWVFDTSDWFDIGKLTALHVEYEDNLYRYKYPMKTLWGCPLNQNISICFCDSEDRIANIYWHTPDWGVIAMDMYRNYQLLSDDLDLSVLFFNNYDWRDYYLKDTDTTKVLRGIKGYPKSYYLCRQTRDWADNCDYCSCCCLIEEHEVGRTIYCNNKVDNYNISDDIVAPYV